MFGFMLLRGAARTSGRAVNASLRTKARKITVVVLAVVSLAIGVHVASGSNAQIARTEKQINQQAQQEGRKEFANAKVPPHTPTCTTTVKSGTHTVRVDYKGRVSHSTTSGTTSKTCK